MTRVKKQKILPKVVGKRGNRVAITHFFRLIGNNFLSFLHRPMVNRVSLSSEKIFLNRREFIQKASKGIALSSTATLPFISTKGAASLKYEMTPYEDITTYNNFYELGTSKSDPSNNAKWLKTNPWSIEVSGLVNKPGKINFEDIVKIPTEERIYRMRCVERWSMVIPWQGFELSKLLQKFEPKSEAKYIEFTAILDPENLYGQRYPVLQWPYVEGLRMDEAMNPLTLMATGIYGKPLLPQNGAPIRLVVPWKYGYKSIKSIQKIRLVSRQPISSWTKSSPNEYGFYSNVNPNVHHPRWRQNRERRIGEFRRRKTLMFNGYQEQVAHLYKGIDLSKYH